MATYAAGVTASFGGTAFGEVQELRVTHGTALPLARATTWALDLGSIELSCFATSTPWSATYGKKSLFVIGGGGIAYTATAVMEKLTLQAKVNDVARYTLSFRVQS